MNQKINAILVLVIVLGVLTLLDSYQHFFVSNERWSLATFQNKAAAYNELVREYNVVSKQLDDISSTPTSRALIESSVIRRYLLAREINDLAGEYNEKSQRYYKIQWRGQKVPEALPLVKGVVISSKEK